MNVISKNNSLGLFIGESFAEVCWLHGTSFKHQRWYLPRQSLKSFLQKWLNENGIQKLDQIFVSQRHLEKIFQYRLGGSVAQIYHPADQFFLPFLQRHSKGSYLKIAKPPELSSQEMCFCFDETDTAAQLIEKLKRQSAKRLCLQSRPQTQALFAGLGKELSDAGYEVFQSFVLHPHDQAISDCERWLENLLNASLAGSFKELRDEVHSAFEGFATADQIYFLNSDLSWTNYDQNKITSSSVALENLLFKHFQTQIKHDLNLFHFGLENFSLIQGPRSRWVNSWGPVGIQTLKRFDLQIQPTQALVLNKYQEVDIDNKELTFEPGPLSLGRGINTCVYDLLSQAQKNPEAWQQADFSQKIHKNLIALSRNSKNKADPELLLDSVTEHILEKILNEVALRSDQNPILVYGHFAGLIKKFNLDSTNFSFVLEPELPKSYAIAAWGAQTHA
jgi:hypothetical protein